MSAKFNAVERFFIDNNHKTMSIPELAKLLKVTERRISNYLANLPVAPEPKPANPENTQSPPSIRRTDLFENKNGSISMTGGQASVKETKPQGNPLFEGKFKNDIFVPDPSKPSY